MKLIFNSSSTQKHDDHTKNLLLPSSFLFFLHLILHTTSSATNPRYCRPSSCGSIRNISFPFRLKDDPKHCGNPIYELECDNNATTTSYLTNSHQKYQVKAINYDNFTIRLTDVSINNTNICSVPNHSLYAYNFNGYPYNSIYNGNNGTISYMRCPYPLKNSSLFTELPTVCDKDNNFFNDTRYTYIKAGRMRASDVEDSCRIDVIVMTSWKFRDLKNVSVSEIHESMLYGFELSWLPDSCSNCGGSRCYLSFGTYYHHSFSFYKWDFFRDYFRQQHGLMPIRNSYSDIKKMTKGFHEKLGQGGYCYVYKGKLRSGLVVAVKVLGRPGGNGKDFMNEIATIGRIHHVNVVNLVGYCVERSKRALVFDFMPNGSLDKYLFGREKMNCLSWERKYEIAVGVAQGIEYLHTCCVIQILHFDIKPHNILLDHNFAPKTTDFGLAKFYSTDKDMVTITAARGTIGYVAPELINRGFGGVSYKADVYSFGMLLMEMLGLNKNIKESNQASSQYFPCWIYDSFEQGQDIEIAVTDVNKNDNSNDIDKKIAKKMTIVALWCIQMNPGDRPSMNKVVEMLEGQLERLRVPSRPSHSAQAAVYYEDESYVAKNIILFPCMIGFLIYKFQRRHLSMYGAIEDFLQSDNKLMPIRYSYSDIKKMTGGFREKLGQGGYGTVYKGKLQSGYDVAVKLLGKPGGNGQDFMKEIATIGRIHHVNVVNLVGYCAQRSKRALVFDFMPNGSLDKYIYSQEKTNRLSWDKKYEIVVGVARGIEYLHRGCDIQILHFDIKPHNILLDDKVILKISDFGLAKYCSTEKNTVTLTAARGT